MANRGAGVSARIVANRIRPFTTIRADTGLTGSGRVSGSSQSIQVRPYETMPEAIPNRCASPATKWAMHVGARRCAPRRCIAWTVGVTRTTPHGATRQYTGVIHHCAHRSHDARRGTHGRHAGRQISSGRDRRLGWRNRKSRGAGRYDPVIVFGPDRYCSALEPEAGIRPGRDPRSPLAACRSRCGSSPIGIYSNRA